MCRAVDLKSIFIRQNALHFNHFLLIYSPVDLQPIDVWNVDKRLIDLEICRQTTAIYRDFKKSTAISKGYNVGLR